MRKAVMILLALLAIRLLPRALRRQARALELVTLLFQLTAAAAANTSKTVAVETRTGNLETRVGNLEQGQVANLQPNSVIGTLQRGIFTNVSGGSTITMETQQGSVTLHCGALSNFTSGPQTTFLASLTQMGPQANWYLNDNFTGPNWGTGERDYINVASSRSEAVKNALVNHGFMAP
jgi:hypothetical protein